MEGNFQFVHPAQGIGIVVVEINKDKEAAMRGHDPKELGEHTILVGIIVERLDGEDFVEEVLLPGDLLG